MRPYDSNRWKKLRLTVLREQPLCIRCQNVGRLRVATTVDHCIPAKAYDDFFDTENLFSVCTQCHSDVTKHFDNRNAHEHFTDNYHSIKYSGREFTRDDLGFPLDEGLDSLLLGMEVVGNNSAPRRFE